MTETHLTARGEKYKTRQAAEKNLPPGFKIVEDSGGFYGIRETGNVICPQCGQSFHSTTDKYDPDRFANPAMIQLKEPYRSWGWEELPKDPSAGYGILVCPDCGGALAPSGKLRVE